MKKMLLESVKVIPLTSGQTVDRLGALSAVLGLSVTSADAGALAKVTVTHADDSAETFEAVPDERIFMDGTVVERDNTGKFVQSFVKLPVATGDLLNVDIDLVGCKQFVKFVVTFEDADGEAATAVATQVVVLGDYGECPAGA